MFRVSDVVCVLLCPLCFWHNVTRIMNGFGTFSIALLSVVLEQWADAFCETDDIPTNDNPPDVHLMIGYLLGLSTELMKGSNTLSCKKSELPRK